MEDHCDECGYDGRGMLVEEVVARLREIPGWFRDAANAFDDEQLRRRPHAEAWSPLEYLVHVRDLIAYHRWLIERALESEAPEIASADPDAAVAAVQLETIDPVALLEQLERRVERLCSTVESLSPDTFTRRLWLVPDPGPIDITLVVRSALHEAVHHRQDLARQQRPAAPEV